LRSFISKETILSSNSEGTGEEEHRNPAAAEHVRIQAQLPGYETWPSVSVNRAPEESAEP
jgi:hypothetical protein